MYPSAVLSGVAAMEPLSESGEGSSHQIKAFLPAPMAAAYFQQGQPTHRRLKRAAGGSDAAGLLPEDL